MFQSSTSYFVTEFRPVAPAALFGQGQKEVACATEHQPPFLVEVRGINYPPLTSCS